MLVLDVKDITCTLDVDSIIEGIGNSMMSPPYFLGEARQKRKEERGSLPFFLCQLHSKAETETQCSIG